MKTSDGLTNREANLLMGIIGIGAMAPSLEGNDAGPWVCGQAYLIRTCTMTLLGRLIGVWPQELALADAAWIADTGRFADAIKGGPSKLAEVEPMGTVIIGRGSIVDAVAWEHELAKEQK